MTKVDIEAVADHGNTTLEREQAQTYVDYLDDLTDYCNDLLGRVVSGIGGNPSSPPPPPPGS